MTTIGNLMASGVPAQEAQYSVAGKWVLNLTATGTSSQAAALQVPGDACVFSTVALNAGAKLPPANASGMVALAGDIYTVVNGGANPLLVYPPLGGNFITVAVNTSVSVPVGKTADFYCLGANVWAPSVGG